MPDTETIPPAEAIEETNDRTTEETTDPYYTEPRDWFFTFGHGQRIFAQNYKDASLGRPVVGQGVHLDGYYVVIHGDFHTARLRMHEIFGPVWCDQYQELPYLADLPGCPVWTELIKIPPGRS